MAEKAAETEEAVAEVMAETVPEEMAENVTKEGAETEIVTVEVAETEEVVKRDRAYTLHLLNTKYCQATQICQCHHKNNEQKWTLKSYNGLKWAKIC